MYILKIIYIFLMYARVALETVGLRSALRQPADLNILGRWFPCRRRLLEPRTSRAASPYH